MNINVHHFGCFYKGLAISTLSRSSRTSTTPFANVFWFFPLLANVHSWVSFSGPRFVRGDIPWVTTLEGVKSSFYPTTMHQTRQSITGTSLYPYYTQCVSISFYSEYTSITTQSLYHHYTHVCIYIYICVIICIYMCTWL